MKTVNAGGMTLSTAMVEKALVEAGDEVQHVVLNPSMLAAIEAAIYERVTILTAASSYEAKMVKDIATRYQTKRTFAELPYISTPEIPEGRIEFRDVSGIVLSAIDNAAPPSSHV